MTTMTIKNFTAISTLRTIFITRRIWKRKGKHSFEFQGMREWSRVQAECEK
jgi:hypothetical protein